MIEIVFDTETTGLSPKDGDRVIEIGCLELRNCIPTGRSFQRYINPERPVPADSTRIHGLTDEFLADKPVFSAPEVIDAFLDFVGDRPLIAHNAEFDRGFINAEFQRLGRPILPAGRFIDTRTMARARFPGLSNSLDSLCKRFAISLEGREFHGALKDVELLAAVYLELRGGREQSLDLAARELARTGPDNADRTVAGQADRVRRRARPRLSAAEKARHEAFVAELGATAIWAAALAPGE